MNASLHEITLELLKKDERPLPIISRESGVSLPWLKKLKSREIEDPSVNRIQKLYEFLSGSQLKV